MSYISLSFLFFLFQSSPLVAKDNNINQAQEICHEITYKGSVFTIFTGTMKYIEKKHQTYARKLDVNMLLTKLNYYVEIKLNELKNETLYLKRQKLDKNNKLLKEHTFTNDLKNNKLTRTYYRPINKVIENKTDLQKKGKTLDLVGLYFYLVHIKNNNVNIDQDLFVIDEKASSDEKNNPTNYIPIKIAKEALKSSDKSEIFLRVKGAPNTLKNKESFEELSVNFKMNEKFPYKISLKLSGHNRQNLEREQFKQIDCL